MANSRVKHIPENSIVIILKFGTSQQKDSVIQDDAFQMYKARLESIAVQKGGVSEYFTH
ncbi:hypothetical protein ES703_117158 [subsurface metagenome]